MEKEQRIRTNPFKTFFTNVKNKMVAKGEKAKILIKTANNKTLPSFVFMGLGQILNRQYVKGLIYIFIQIGAIFYFIFKGAQDLVGLFTLGVVPSNPWMGIVGDNSVVMLILGLLAFIFLILYVFIYVANIKDAYNSQLLLEAGKKPKSFKEEVRAFFDQKFYISALFIPFLGVAIFNVLPIVFMILIGFTNYGGDIALAGDLVSWVGLSNFKQLLLLGNFAKTFFKILGWNFLWAILSTFINYFLGLSLALLYSKKVVKGKAFWRAFPIIAYAVPGFITLLAFKFMFSYGGPINQMITSSGGTAIGFLDIDAKWKARFIGLAVNAWITVPSSMLLATGILSNLNRDVYEAAELDGAKSWHKFKDLTLPFVIFATTPVLITQFIGNFNNFGIFYFLRGGLTLDGYFLASDTDLLINWLYKLSIDNSYYSIGAAISLIIFIITSIISLTVYILSPAYKEEGQYK